MPPVPTPDAYPGNPGGTLYAGKPTPSGGTTPATLTLVNTSASQQASGFVSPMFGVPLKQGDVPTGTYPQFLVGEPILITDELRVVYGNGLGGVLIKARRLASHGRRHHLGDQHHRLTTYWINRIAEPVHDLAHLFRDERQPERRPQPEYD